MGPLGARLISTATSNHWLHRLHRALLHCAAQPAHRPQRHAPSRRFFFRAAGFSSSSSSASSASCANQTSHDCCLGSAQTREGLVSTAQHSTAQRSTAQRCPAPHRPARNGTAPHRTARPGPARPYPALPCPALPCPAPPRPPRLRSTARQRSRSTGQGKSRLPRMMTVPVPAQSRGRLAPAADHQPRGWTRRRCKSMRSKHPTAGGRQVHHAYEAIFRTPAVAEPY